MGIYMLCNFNCGNVKHSFQNNISVIKSEGINCYKYTEKNVSICL